MDKTSIGDRMKMYESLTENRLMPRLPIVIRLDGRSFSKFTKGMKRPFDDDFRQAMVEVTKYLVEQTHAKIGYTQSDEISLVLYTDNIESGATMFEGRIQKIASNFASMASVKFLLEMQKRFPEKVSGNKTLPSFDCRVFTVPSKTEAANAIVWRVQDASKNSVAMVSQANFSHKELQGLSCKEQQYKLLTEKDINWNDFTSAQKQGVFVRKEKIQVVLEQEKLDKIPKDRQPEGGVVTRNKMVEMDMPNFLKVVNRTEVIFDGEEPKCEVDDTHTIIIDFDTDDDFYLVSSIDNEKEVYVVKTFKNKPEAIDYINSLSVIKRNERHYPFAVKHLERFKREAIEAINSDTACYFGGNWEFSVNVAKI